MAVDVAGSSIKKRLIAVGNDEFWYEDIDVGAGEWTELVAANGDIDTTKQLWAFELLGKVFVVNGTNRKVADFINVKIVAADLVGVGAGVAPPDFGTVLTGGTSGAKMKVDYITALDGGTTIYGRRTTVATFEASETVTGLDDDGNTVSFIMTAADEVSGPHWYDWTVYGNSATYGTMPAKLTLGCSWNGRAVVAGNEDDANQWYMSRQSCPWDFNYISDDPQSPISGEDAEPGKVGDVIVAMIPYSKDYFVFGNANSIWYAVGNPAANGAILALDDTGGILDSQAWCKDEKDNLYILATTGLLKIPPGFGQPENLFETDYPDFIKDFDFDGSLHRAILGYDRLRNGIKIVKTTLTTGANSCFWYDLKTAKVTEVMGTSLFPETYPNECGIYCLFDYAAVDAGYSGLLHGCKDGYVRVEDSDAKDDDIGATDQAIDGYVTFGPLQLNESGKEGGLNAIDVVTVGGLTGGSETDSNNVDLKVWTGLSADAVTEKLIANSTPQIGGTVTAPGRRRGNKIRRKVRGAHLGLRVGNATAAQTWGLEKVILDVKKGGKIK